MWRLLRWVSYIAIGTLAGAVVGEPEVEMRILGLGGALALVAVALAIRPGPALQRVVRTKFVRALDIVLFNVAVAVVLLELGLAAAARLFPSPIFVQTRGAGRDLIEGFRLHPGVETNGHPVNSMGFLDTEFTIEKRPGVFRITALGDSFCVGIVPYERNFLNLIEEDLGRRRRERGKGDLEVYNFGIGATDPQDYAMLYATEARPYAADLLLVNVFVGNDITTLFAPGFLDPERWYLYSVPQRLLAVWKEARRRGVPLSEVATAGGVERPRGDGTTVTYHDDWRLEKAALSEEEFFRLELTRLFACHVKRDREYEETLEILRRLAAGAGVPVVIALIPDEFQVNDEVYEEIFSRHPWIERRKFDRMRPQKEFARWCAEQEIPLIDLLPALARGQAEIGRVYHLRDTHWNAAGNRIAAREIGAFLDAWLRERGE